MISVNYEHNDEFFSEAAELIHEAKHLLITAGAGMGVDSGMPDFRGQNGFYKAYPGFKKESLNFSDVANPFFLFRQPEKFWWFYGQRFELYNKTEPHHGYHIIKHWLKQKDGFVVTSNVDGHFEKVGVPGSRVLECHGSINFLQCSMDCNNSLWRLERLPFKIDIDEPKISGIVPRCPSCGGFARPAILMFYDNSWNSARTSKQMDRFNDWRNSIDDLHLVVIEIGAGQSIPRIRWQSESMHSPIIRINANKQDARVDYGVSLPVRGLQALERIQRKLIEMDQSFSFQKE